MSTLTDLYISYIEAENKKYTDELKPIDFQGLDRKMPPECIGVWRSNRFLVQLYAPKDGAQRITISRTMIDKQTGNWLEGITWDEIQDIKRKLGFGDCFAVEIYPADADVVNVANMRHIWMIDPLPFAWRKNK
jgi:hypothetical protein